MRSFAGTHTAANDQRTRPALSSCSVPEEAQVANDLAWFRSWGFYAENLGRARCLVMGESASGSRQRGVCQEFRCGAGRGRPAGE